MSPRAARSAAPAPVIRVALVDDSRPRREGWALVLGAQSDIDVVGQAGDATRGLALARHTPVDVVLVALQLPPAGGLEFTARLRDDKKVAAAGPAPRVIVLTAVELESHLAAAADAGAFAILWSDVDPEGLLATIRSAAAQSSR